MLRESVLMFELALKYIRTKDGLMDTLRDG